MNTITLFKDYEFKNIIDIHKYMDIYTMEGAMIEKGQRIRNKMYYTIYEYSPFGLDKPYLVYIDLKDYTLHNIDGFNIVELNIAMEVEACVQDEQEIKRIMEG